MALSIKHGGSTITTPTSTSPKVAKVIRITPTISGTAYSAGDVLFLTTEIPNAVRIRGGCSRLVGISMYTHHDAEDDVGLVFMENSTNLIGALSPSSSGGPTITDDNGTAAKFLSGCVLNGSDNTQDLGDSRLYSTIAYSGNSVTEGFSPMLLQAASDSTSVYVAGLAADAQDYGADGDLELIFHIEYLS